MAASAGPSGVNKEIKKKPLLDQICQAVYVLSKPKVGASFMAIKKHILEGYEESDHNRVISRMKKAVSIGVESGQLVRPPRCKDSVGANGSFLLSAEQLKNMTDAEKPQKHPEKRNVKKLYQEDSKAHPKPIKPKARKTKNPIKKEKHDGESDVPMTNSTPKNSDSEFEQDPVKTRELKKTAKHTKDMPKTMKKHASDSDLTDVMQKTVKRKNLKETKTTLRKIKPGTSDSKETKKEEASDSKETEKEEASEVNNEMKKLKRTLKSHNSDSILM